MRQRGAVLVRTAFADTGRRRSSRKRLTVLINRQVREQPWREAKSKAKNKDATPTLFQIACRLLENQCCNPIDESDEEANDA